MKNRKIKMVCLLCVLAVVLGGCSVRNVSRGQAEGEAYDAVISVKGRDEAAAGSGSAGGGAEENAEVSDDVTEQKASDVTLEDDAGLELLLEQMTALTELVGKDDETAAELLGGGEENRTADGALLIGRSYRIELFGQECSVYTSYDEAGLVSVVVAELPGQDVESCKESLTELFGDAVLSEDEEAEEKSWYWESGGYRFTLYEFDDALSLDVNWAAF